jgi:hypothetical protein
MTEAELRSLVREVIARRAAPTPAPAVQPAAAGLYPAAASAHAAIIRHGSHAMFALPVGSDTDGPCLIEPAVACVHCGYCRSYGH